jgi:flagellar basal-body rod protein FlgF
MIRGMYASAAGMATGIARQDLHAGNLANVDTVGYRRTRYATQAFAAALETASADGTALRGGTGLVAATLDVSEAANKKTDNKLDLAINGQGMFAVQTPQGMRYTRDGRMHLDPGGRVVDAQNNPLVGVNGYIDVPMTGGKPTAQTDPFEVGEAGQVRSGGKIIGEILVVDVPTASLKAEGGGLYSSTAMPARATQARIAQGYLEESNVAATQELGAMIRNSRFYDANASALKQQDQATEQLLGVLSGG